MNVPNILTTLRVILAILIFIAIPCNQFAIAFVLFILACITDFLDGYWARKYNQITVFGRIMDPFADKLLVCGTLIALLGVPCLIDKTGLAPWMCIVIVARELWITSLRAIVEKEGGDFSAKWIGKWKMGLQCVTIAAHLMLGIVDDPVVLIVAVVSLWGTLAITIWSGISYTKKALGFRL